MRARTRTLATVALLLVLPATALGEGATPARVVSVIGKVTANGNALKTDDSTRLSAVAPGTMLQVSGGAVAQLMLRGSLSVGIMGQATVTVGGKSADVEVHQSEGAVRLGGAGGSLTVKGWRVALAPAGASVILHGSRLYVLEGTALVQMPRVVTPKPVPPASEEPGQPGMSTSTSTSASTTTAPPSPPAPVLPTTTTLAAGKAMALSLKIVPATAGATPPTVVLRATSAHGTPAAWMPGLGSVSLQDVQQARVWMQAERQAQRETAACGCTEGGGAQVGALGGKGVETGNVQKTTTVIKIRIDGVPKKGK